ncbi:MAG: hypothetical protein LBV39_05390 [Bacteroidales bacterium]|jgi:hypothetical protein|nr:hypothetical protein [Bacteroidales bacterium]
MELKKIKGAGEQLELDSNKYFRYDDNTLVTCDYVVSTFDISNPLDIKLLSRVESDNFGGAFALQNQKIYLLHRWDSQRIRILDASNPLNIHLASTINVDTKIRHIAISPAGIFYGISEQGKLGIIDNAGHFTALYSLGISYGKENLYTHITIENNLLIIDALGIFLRLFEIKDDGTVEALSKICYYTKANENFKSFDKLDEQDNDDRKNAALCVLHLKTSFGFPVKAFTVLGGKYLLHAWRHILLIDICNPKAPKLTDMITISEKNMHLRGDSHCYYSENEIMINTQDNMVYLVELSPEGAKLKQSIRIEDAETRTLMRKDNYLLALGSTVEIFEIN